MGAVKESINDLMLVAMDEADSLNDRFNTDIFGAGIDLSGTPQIGIMFKETFVTMPTWSECLRFVTPPEYYGLTEEQVSAIIETNTKLIKSFTNM